MLVLGIDPGLALTGYGLLYETETGDLELVDCGVIKTAAGEPNADRLLAIDRQLNALLQKHAPDVVAVEELFFCKNVTTALIVGQARGVVLLAAARAGLPVFEYKPMAVKQAVAGYGHASKSQVQEMVRLLLRLDQVPHPDDAADAVAVAVCHIYTYRLNQLVGE